MKRNFSTQNSLEPDQNEAQSTLSLIITEINRDNSNFITSCILLDLQRRFDTISHEYLLYKLEDVSVRGVYLNRFTSYLSERSQCVSINGKVSKHYLLTVGVLNIYSGTTVFFMLMISRTRVKTFFSFSSLMTLNVFT